MKRNSEYNKIKFYPTLLYREFDITKKTLRMPVSGFTKKRNSFNRKIG